ncbi:MAG: transcriptional regulator [Pseudomonadota bacterium]|nr:transcriptional regulator [Pseudomonadota bacterium]
MPLTREFRIIVKDGAERDPEFRTALYREALEALLAGDAATGKAMLRDFVNATIGFEQLEVRTGTPRKSLMRMLSPAGNPGLNSLLLVFKALNEIAGTEPEVHVR